MPTEPLTDADEAPEYTLPPFIRRVRIRGYKSIEFCDVELHPLTILVGRNAAGKSNFLDALGFVSDLMDRRASEAVNDRKGWRAIRCNGSNRRDIEFLMECEFKSGNTRWTADYGFALVMVRENQILIRKEHLTLKDGMREVGYSSQEGRTEWKGAENIRSEPDSYPSSSEEITFSKLDNLDLPKQQRYDRLLLSVIGNQPFVDLAESFRASCVYNFLPGEIRQHRPISTTSNLNCNGGNLARAIEGIREIEPESLQRLKSYLRVIVPDVEDFWTQTYGDYETLRFAMSSSPGLAAREFDASSMSDGTLRVLASLVAAFQFYAPNMRPGFIGIEEPETALHPAAMRALVDALDEATQRTQILLTTHSAELLTGRDVKPGQVLVVRNREGKTLMTPLDPASQEIIAKELYSLADLQRMDKLDLDEVDLQRQAALNGGGD